MRLFQPEIANYSGVKRLDPRKNQRRRSRKVSVRPARRPKPGADFQVWFDYLLRSGTQYFKRLNQARTALRRGTGVGWMKGRRSWPGELRAFCALVEPAMAAERWQWDEDGAGAQAHFILYPDRPSRQRKFEVTLRLVFTSERMILSRFGLELIDQTRIDPGDYFERQRGFQMQISSSSSSYLAAPPPSGR